MLFKYLILFNMESSIKLNNKNDLNYYFLDEVKLNKINKIYINKYLLRKILYEFTPLIILSFLHLNNGSILLLSILQLLLTKNILNLITCSLFFIYFNLSKDLNILYTYGVYLLILFIIESILVYEYMNINIKFLCFIGVIFSAIFLKKLYMYNINNIFILSSFIIGSTTIIPYNINNSLDFIKKNKNIETINNSYHFM